MNIPDNSQKKGFTLLETVLVIFIFGLLMLGVDKLAVAIFSSFRQQSSSINDVDYAMKAASDFANEIRNAAYGNDGSYSLNQAGSSQIIFYSSYGTSGNLVNRIRYYLLSSMLYKGVVIPTGSPLVYNLASETVTPVRTGLANGNIPVFYYYDGNYNGSTTPLSEPINVNQVKFVRINLMIVKNPEVSTTTVFSIGGGATIRNLKNNLGN